MWLDPFCRNLELAAQAEHEDDLPENLSEIADLWNSPTRTHVSLVQWADSTEGWGSLPPLAGALESDLLPCACVGVYLCSS